MRRLDLLPSTPFYPTASELHRAAECIAPWALGLPESEEEPGEWAEQGRRLHAGAEAACKAFTLESWIAGSSEMASSEKAILEHVFVSALEDRRACKPWLSGTGPHNWLVEQGVAWRPDFPEDVAKLVQREPGERLRGWFAGTADLAYVRHDGVLVVADWKFGAQTRWIGEHAEDHTQLWTLALALTTALEITAARPDDVIARVEARHVDENGIVVDGHDLTGRTLQEWGKALTLLAKRIDEATDARPRLSQACGRCEAKAACPSWEHFTLEIASQMSDAAEALTRPPESPFDVSVIHHGIEAAEHAVEQWKEWRKAWLLLHPEGVPVGLGLELRTKPRASRAVVKTPEAMALIEAVAGMEAIKAEKSSSLKLIEAAVRRTNAGITSKSDRDKANRSAIDDTMARLVDGGAVEEKGKTWAVGLFRSDGSEVKQVDRMGEEGE